MSKGKGHARGAVGRPRADSAPARCEIDREFAPVCGGSHFFCCNFPRPPGAASRSQSDSKGLGIRSCGELQFFALGLAQKRLSHRIQSRGVSPRLGSARAGSDTEAALYRQYASCSKNLRFAIAHPALSDCLAPNGGVHELLAARSNRDPRLKQPGPPTARITTWQCCVLSSVARSLDGPRASSARSGLRLTVPPNRVFSCYRFKKAPLRDRAPSPGCRRPARFAASRRAVRRSRTRRLRAAAL